MFVDSLRASSSDGLLPSTKINMGYVSAEVERACRRRTTSSETVQGHKNVYKVVTPNTQSEISNRVFKRIESHSSPDKGSENGLTDRTISLNYKTKSFKMKTMVALKVNCTKRQKNLTEFRNIQTQKVKKYFTFHAILKRRKCRNTFLITQTLRKH